MMTHSQPRSPHTRHDAPDPASRAVAPHGLMGGMGTRCFILTTVRQLVPSLVLNIACTVILYSLLRPHFPASSIVPLAVASLCPVLGNIASIARHRRVDIFGVMVLIGLAVSIVGVLLGGGERLLLLRESLVTAAGGLALLVSLLLPKPLGYDFARQLLTGNDPEKAAQFAALWHDPAFRRAMRGGTILWGGLLLGEFGLRPMMALTLPVVLVLAISPIVFNALIFGGVVVSAVWGGRLLRQYQMEMRGNAQGE